MIKQLTDDEILDAFGQTTQELSEPIVYLDQRLKVVARAAHNNAIRQVILLIGDLLMMTTEVRERSLEMLYQELKDSLEEE